VRIDHVLTSGIFSIDGEDFEVENNIWIAGDNRECIVVDAAHDHRPIVDGIGGRTVKAIVLTHGHNDHINAAAQLADAVGGPPMLLHADDRMLWDVVHPEREPDGELHAGQLITVGGSELSVLHTPGHSPGGCCLSAAADGVLFSGDTLFNGGPGATGRSFSSFDTIIDSLRRDVIGLPGATRVLTGHGDETTVGAEAAHFDEYVARGH
jgi:glyoxylase-like metal-dependent hydrolase (beta-lactamase superfamily II)